MDGFTPTYPGFPITAAMVTSGVFVPARLGTGSAITTKFLRGDGTWQTVVSGVDGFTGSLNTSSPNATVNVSRLLASGGTSSQDITIQPKGDGAFQLSLPDETTTGGNKRGQNSIDLQITRTAATQVASGNYSAIAGGSQNTVSGAFSGTLAGKSNIVSGNYSSAIGYALEVQTNHSCAFGTGGKILVGANNSFLFAGGQVAFLESTNTALFADVDVWIAATNGQPARALRFYEPNLSAGSFAGGHYSSFKAGVQAANITYTLPTADGSSGQALVTDASGVLSWGNVAAATGTLAQFASTTSLELKGVIVDETGSGSLVFANTPTLVTPVLGVATATSINGATITTTTGTLTLVNGSTLVTAGAFSNTLTTTGTTNVTLPTTGTLSTLAGTEIFTNKTLTSPTLTTPALGVATATSINGATITTTTGTMTLVNGSTLVTAGAFSNTLTTTGTTNVTLPTSGTLSTLAGTETFTNKTLTSPTFTTPALGVATATSINGATITTTTGTLTLVNGSTLVTAGAFSNTLTTTGTTNVTLPTNGILATLAGTEILTSKTLTSPTLTTPVLGVATATSINGATITTTTGTLTLVNGSTLVTAGAFSNTLTTTGTTNVTLPTTGTLATLAGTETLTGKTLTSPTMTTPTLGTPASGVMTNVTGTAASLTAGKATNIAGGTGGRIPYQSAADTTALLANGTNGQYLTSSGGTSAPTWTTSAGLTGFTASLNTSSPNNTDNASMILSSGGTTNQDAVVSPKGTGAFQLHLADSTTTGGNKRGTNALDLQTLRSANTEVASGVSSIVVGSSNTASETYSRAIGYANTASGYGSQAVGISTTAIGSYSIAEGFQSKANNDFQSSFACGQISALGDAQISVCVVTALTTNATQTEMSADSQSNAGRVSVPSGRVYAFEVRILGKRTDTGTDIYHGVIQGTIGNYAGTTALNGSTTTTVITNSSGTWSAVVTADNGNDRLAVKVTGQAAATIRWVASVRLIEVAS
ncbi:MAG: hypothetical protein IPM69_14910 [Ignavibacteria bacterium]|nr:hypothetical protein [Ignavibacteria bacterium]